MKKSLTEAIGYSALIAAFLTLIIHLVRANSYQMRAKKRQKLLEKAVSRGHVVTAQLKKTNWSHPESDGPLERQSVAVYEYQYQGRTYHYRQRGSGQFPGSVTLYFDQNPARAYTADRISDASFRWPLVYLICFAALLLLNMYMRGYLG